MPLSPVDMEQIRELIRYDAAVHQSLSSTMAIVIAGLTALGGLLYARWRQRRLQDSCPICRAPPGKPPVDSIKPEAHAPPGYGTSLGFVAADVVKHIPQEGLYLQAATHALRTTVPHRFTVQQFICAVDQAGQKAALSSAIAGDVFLSRATANGKNLLPREVEGPGDLINCAIYCDGPSSRVDGDPTSRVSWSSIPGNATVELVFVVMPSILALLPWKAPPSGEIAYDIHVAAQIVGEIGNRGASS